MVGHARATRGHQHAQQAPEAEADQQAEADTEEGPGEVFQNLRADGRTSADNRLAEIAMQQPAEVVQVLQRQRPVQVDREECAAMFLAGSYGAPDWATC